ncbi:MAG: FtsH protease activity modulator HflK [Vicinamibacteria bacterium]|nr:FtsH protease activity modulator HflK [Vicinamibacteria bacterium]
MAEYGRQDPLEPLWEAIGDMGKRVRGSGGGGISSSLLRNYAIGALVFLFLFTGFYQVAADEVAVIQRFGKYVRTAGPGPHFRLPFGIERLTRVPDKRQLKMEFGFETLRAGTQSEFRTTEETRKESLMLTGDLNVAVVEWIVQYRIKDPYRYLFHLRSVSVTLRDMTESTMREVVGDHSVDEVLTVGREAIALQTREELQALCDHYGNGIEIQQLVLQDVNPPDEVKPAFNEVNQAIQEKERAINEALADYNSAVPQAKGEAEQQVRAAEGYSLERVNVAEGDAKRFEAVYAEYKKAPQVTRRRLYLETLARVLEGSGSKIIVDQQAKGILPLLQLDGLTTDVTKEKK